MNLMDNKAFVYMIDLLKKKYSLYYERLSKDILKSHIFTTIYKEYGTDRICNGEADGYFIELINSYIEENYVNNFDDTAELKNYIRMVVTQKPSVLSYKKQNKILEYVIDNIALELTEKTVGVSLDEKIIKIFNKYIDTLNENIDFYIDEFFTHSIFIKVSNEQNYYYLKNNLIKKIAYEKNLDEVLNGKCDTFILNCYKELVEATKNKVKKHIHRYIGSLDFPFNISETMIIADINKKIFETGEFTLDDLFEGKLNSYIVVQGKRFKEDKKRMDAINFIYDVISRHSNGAYNKDELIQFSIDILNVLNEKYNRSYFDICYGNNYKLILGVYNRMVMKKNSVVDTKKPTKIKHKIEKKKINKMILWLVSIMLVASLTVSGVISYNNTIDHHEKISNVTEFDGYNYSYIYSVDNDRVSPTAGNAYDFYKKVVDAGFEGELYGYLGFYKAYLYVCQDRLYIMDRMLMNAKVEAKYSEDGEVSERFYEQLAGNSCFLEFAINQLLNMGCKDAAKFEYLDALNEYKRAMELRGTPMDNISEKSQEDIKELMEMYREYSDDLLYNFGKALEQKKIVIDAMPMFDNGQSRRGV